MARLSISILKRHQRADGSFPVLVALSHKSKTVYIDINRTAFESQVMILKTKSVVKIKEKEVKLQRTLLNIIKEYEDALSEIKGIDRYSANQLKEILVKVVKNGPESIQEIDFLAFLRDKTKELKSKDKKEWSNFNLLANNLTDFIKRPVLFTSEINNNFLIKFSSYLQTERVVIRNNQGKMRERVLKPAKPAGVYSVMKDFRTAFNDTREMYNDENTGYIPIPNYPFKNFHLSNPLTDPRGWSASEIADLYRLYDKYDDMLYRERLGLDMFFLSFFLAGINTADIYRITKQVISNNRLTYRRSKTKDRRKDGAKTSIKIEPQAKEILNRYFSPDGDFLLSTRFSKPEYLTRAINNGLASLRSYKVLPKVTMYVARHSWATIARNECGVSKDDISMSLNHTDPARKTTDIYLKTDWNIIDRANKKVIDHLFSLMQ